MCRSWSLCSVSYPLIAGTQLSSVLFIQQSMVYSTWIRNSLVYFFIMSVAPSDPDGSAVGLANLKVMTKDCYAADLR